MSHAIAMAGAGFYVPQKLAAATKGPGSPLPCLVYAAFAPSQEARHDIHTLHLGTTSQDAGQVGALEGPSCNPFQCAPDKPSRCMSCFKKVP